MPANAIVSKVLYFVTACCISLLSAGAANHLPTLLFERISTQHGLPTNEINQVYQDKGGYIWFATNSGLCQYDGYTIRTFKSNLQTPDLLNNNKVNCVMEDGHHRLWIGTYNGLNVLDKITGKIQKIDHPELMEEVVFKLLITQQGEVIIGTERGLFRYDPENNAIKHYRDGLFSGSSIKSLLADSNGHIWVGTWSNGVHRYDPEEELLYSYPPFSANNAGYALWEDSRQRIWVGTWDDGLYLVENPYEMDNLQVRAFRYNKNNPNSIGDSYIYSISEDLNTGMIWIGTRNGLSVLYNEKEGAFHNYVPDNSSHSISYNVVTSVSRSQDGLMWLGTTGGGIHSVSTHKSDFAWNKIDGIQHEFIRNPSVRGLMVDKDGKIWLGLGNLGFLIYNRITNTYEYNLTSKDFAFIGRVPTVNTLFQSPSTGKIWIGTYDWGVIEYDEKAPEGQRARLLNRDVCPWMSNQCIFSIMEDRSGNTWFGTRNGINVIMTDGEGINLNHHKVEGSPISSFAFVTMAEDKDGVIWTGTSNAGIFRITGQPGNESSLFFTKYSPDKNTLNSVSVTCLFLDKKNRLWAGTDGAGLSLYNVEKDLFEPVHQMMHLPGDAVFSIQEDTQGNLWMGTDVGLIRLHILEETHAVTYRLYTQSDGLQDNIFNRNAAFTDINGEMFFAGHHGYNSFYPDRMTHEEIYPPVFITDIKIYNQSWYTLHLREKEKISAESPAYTSQIRLNHRNNNFDIEFAALNYLNPSQIKYAYRLDGFDPDWQYTDASRRFAYYNNLDAGNYTFRLKSTNANGSWNNQEKLMQVTILPPPWKTWWAYLIYAALILAAAYGIIRFIRYRIKLTQALQIAELERVKRDEINHSKLQFFTNITHEFLTPLTILSASVEDLKMQMPQKDTNFHVMTNNINRLIRLLQQILEFRKVESGNLKLKVSQGDLATFVGNSVESFHPLIKKKQIQFLTNCSPGCSSVWFDPDKVDKILYNLLSNAAKYNTPGAIVRINLETIEGGKCIELTVEDNGKGMSEEATEKIFERFYEGDYRKSNTIGTGIGLSLTKDLVELHKGSIQVESEPDKGTLFRVRIPVLREAYEEAEIDDLPVILPEIPTGEAPEFKDKKNLIQGNKASILLIEDNEELLDLMVKLLSVDYIVFTSKTGKEGLSVMEQREIDLVVSDIMMPEMDGMEFCRQLKSNINTSHIPVILLTAKNKEQDRVEAYESGADGFITKPFTLSVLYARITNLLKVKERNSRDFKKQLVFEATELNYTSLDEEFLQKAIDLIHEHLEDGSFDQQIFMETMGTSKSTLYRKIKSLTGLNTSAFIRNIRLKAACRIMEEKKNIRISELAYAVGFNDPKYFSVCFKKEFGMQPSEYLERFTPSHKKTK